MMIQSVVALNPDNPIAQADLADIYRLHQRVMNAFPAPLPPAERVLFRLDTRGPTPWLLVQSHVAPPVWAYLLNGYALRIDRETAADDYPPAAELQFTLHANPVVRRAGRNVALNDAAEQSAWLTTRASRHGFRVDALQFHDLGAITGYRPSGARGDWLTIRAVRYTGRLTVTNPPRFTATLREGIGRGRAFGCGLLTVSA